MWSAERQNKLNRADLTVQVGQADALPRLWPNAGPYILWGELITLVLQGGPRILNIEQIGVHLRITGCSSLTVCGEARS